MIAPPYTDVKLVEFSDRLELCPVGWYRDRLGLGKYKADKVGFEPHEKMFAKWNEIMGSNEIWVVVHWMVFSDESDKVDHAIFCRPGTTLEDAKKVFEEMEKFLDSSEPDKETRPGLIKFYNHLRTVAPYGVWITHGDAGESEEETRYTSAIVHSYSDQKTTETRAVYQARLKVLAGMGPKTVALMHNAEEAKDDSERTKLEREAVQAFFAEVATYWTEEMLMAWQRNNPLGSKWLCEFGKVMEAPERRLDPVEHELALNWLHRGYNLMTENELSDAIFKTNGQRIKPNTLKKKRAKLGLPGRPFGPRPKSWW